MTRNNKNINLNKLTKSFIGGGGGEVAQSCPTLCDPIDCNLLGSSVHGIIQARILEWIAITGIRMQRETKICRLSRRLLSPFQLLSLVSFPEVTVILTFNTKGYFLPVFLNFIEMELYSLYFYILIFLAQNYVMRYILF